MRAPQLLELDELVWLLSILFSLSLSCYLSSRLHLLLLLFFFVFALAGCFSSMTRRVPEPKPIELASRRTRVYSGLSIIESAQSIPATTICFAVSFQP